MRGSVFILVLPLIVMVLISAGCRTPDGYREQADRRAYRAIEAAQMEVLGRTEPFTIETPADALRRRLMLDQNLPYAGSTNPPPTDTVSTNTITLTLLDALQVAAHNSRSYQSRKESVFQTALALDLERHEFRTQFGARLSSLFTSDRASDTDGTVQSANLEASKRLTAGPETSVQIGLDLARILSGEHESSLGIVADASISIPLLRGRGRAVVRESLTQAERDTVYAIYGFEEFKRSFAVSTAADYLSVLQGRDRVRNAEENLKRLQESSQRARALADAGRLPEVEVDQSGQDELSAHARWINSRQTYEQSLDAFKVSLGLPPDARIDLDPKELERLGYSASPERLKEAASIDPGPAVRLALNNRLDMLVSQARVEDAERAIRIAADGLRAELTLLGSASAGESRSIGSAGEADAELKLNDGVYSGLLTLDLPLDRTSERNAYRNSLIALNQAMRAAQEQEDSIKLAIRNGSRRLKEAADTVAIQRRAVELAEQREKSTGLFLQAGRAQMRDLLDAQEALLSARNALTAAIVSLRVAMLELQRDLGILKVDHTGLWTEAVIADAVEKAEERDEGGKRKAEAAGEGPPALP